MAKFGILIMYFLSRFYDDYLVFNPPYMRILLQCLHSTRRSIQICEKKGTRAKVFFCQVQKIKKLLSPT